MPNDLPTHTTDAAGGTPSDADDVGYRRPPKHSRFKPGQSGNPSGRPKARPSFRRDFASKLLTRMSSGNATKWDAMCERLANAGVANTGVALKLVPLVIALFKDSTDDDSELTAQQTALVNDFEARQELAKSATQSDTQQLTTKQSENGDDNDEIS